MIGCVGTWLLHDDSLKLTRPETPSVFSASVMKFTVTAIANPVSRQLQESCFSPLSRPPNSSTFISQRQQRATSTREFPSISILSVCIQSLEVSLDLLLFRVYDGCRIPSKHCKPAFNSRKLLDLFLTIFSWSLIF
jgi:hypothetical protein